MAQRKTEIRFSTARKGAADRCWAGAVVPTNQASLVKIPMMSDCLLRISEVVEVNIEDVDTTLTIRSSKTDQEGKGESLFIGEPTHNAINKYCDAGEIESGALFRRIRRG